MFTVKKTYNISMIADKGYESSLWGQVSEESITV